MSVPWKVLVTVPTIAAIAIAALAANQIEIAALAAGALVGYLGKVNGQSRNGEGSGT